MMKIGRVVVGVLWVGFCLFGCVVMVKGGEGLLMGGFLRIVWCIVVFG